MRARHATVGIASSIVLLTACASSGGGTSATPAPDSSTGHVTSEIPEPTAEALPAVTFDPCDRIDDALVIHLGLEPATRSREQREVGREEINACNFLGNDRAVGVIAQNTPWDAIPFQVPTESMTVNGREALLAVDSAADDTCTVLMRTDFGAVVVDTFPLRGGNADPNMHACDGIVDMAAAIEPLIQDGN